MSPAGAGHLGPGYAKPSGSEDQRPKPAAPADPQKKGGAGRVNQAVLHPLWGRGTVLAAEGEGDDLRLTVRFESAGTKKIASKFANLKYL